jgi:hypothetical protein
MLRGSLESSGLEATIVTGLRLVVNEEVKIGVSVAVKPDSKSTRGGHCLIHITLAKKTLKYKKKT